jgi:hypothetical protein
MVSSYSYCYYEMLRFVQLGLDGYMSNYEISYLD